VLARAEPIIASYAMRFRESHGDGSVAIAGLGLLGILGALAAGIRFWPKANALALSAIGVLFVIASGNAVACVTAVGMFAVTLLPGDALSRLIRGRESREGELSTSVAAGCAALGVCLLLLGEVRLARPVPLAAAAALLGVARWRRIPHLAVSLIKSARRAIE